MFCWNTFGAHQTGTRNNQRGVHGHHGFSPLEKLFGNAVAASLLFRRSHALSSAIVYYIHMYASFCKRMLLLPRLRLGPPLIAQQVSGACTRFAVSIPPTEARRIDVKPAGGGVVRQ